MKNTSQQPYKTSSIKLYSFVVPLVIGILLLGGGFAFYKTQQKQELKYSLENKHSDKEIRSENRVSKDDAGEEKVLQITEEELNGLIAAQVVGKGVEGYIVSSAEVTLYDGRIALDGELSDGTVVIAEVVVSDDGKDFEITDLTLQNAGALASVKESILRTFLGQALGETIEKYGSQLDHVEVTSEMLVVYYY